MKFFTLILIFTLSSLTCISQTNHVVISEVFGAGGNTGAVLKSDFIELYNPTANAVSLEGWSIQYASVAGANWSKTDLSGTIAANGYYLIKQNDGAGGTVNLPTPDKIGTLNMAGTSGKVALVNNLTLFTVSTPTGASLVDLVGYGITTGGAETESTGTALTSTTSAERKANAASTVLSMATGGADALKGNGYDTENNKTDFITKSGPEPQNSATPIETVTPITLKIFSAMANGSSVTLNWVTSAEINNQYFEIQHSSNGINFTSVAKVNGAVNSSEEKSYQFTHFQPSQGTNYYRLSQTDLNGDSETFEVKAVKVLSANKAALSVYPNPVNASTQLALNSAASNLELKVTNTNGKIVLKTIGNISQINQYFKQNIDALAAGAYFISIGTPTQNYQATVVKQ